MSDEKAAERQRRYRIREKARAQARFAGATEIPLAWFGITSAGTHFAIDADGNTLHLIVKTATVADQVTNVHTLPTKRLYPPKAMSRAQYETNVSEIQAKNTPKDQVRKIIGAAIDSSDDTDAKKAGRQFLALVDALPEGPDWFDHFPDCPEEE